MAYGHLHFAKKNGGSQRNANRAMIAGIAAVVMALRLPSQKISERHHRVVVPELDRQRNENQWQRLNRQHPSGTIQL
jgi:hypothetical protein